MLYMAQGAAKQNIAIYGPAAGTGPPPTHGMVMSCSCPPPCGAVGLLRLLSLYFLRKINECAIIIVFPYENQ